MTTFANQATQKPEIRFNATNGKWEVSYDGVTFNSIATRTSDGVVLRIEVIKEEDGRFGTFFESADGKTAGNGEYAETLVGALANLCATLIKIDEFDSMERREAAK